MIKKIILACSLLFAIAPLSFASADTTTQAPVVYVQNIVLDNSTYKAGDTVKGSFTLANQEDVALSNVTYSVSLAGDYQKNGLANTIYGTQSVTAPIFLNPKENKKITFSYTLPQAVSGTNLGIEISSMLTTGIVLDWSDSQHITVTGGLSLVNITSASVVVGGQQFGLQEGPTIAADQTGSLNLKLSNPSTKSITLTPVVKIYDFSTAGALLKSYNDTSVTLAAGAATTTTLVLPTFNNTAKVYAGTVVFADPDGIARTIPVEFRYIVGGDIVNIRGVVTDKQSVVKGDALAVSVNYTGTPHNIVANQTTKVGLVNLNVRIYNEKNDLVGQDTEQIDPDTTQSKAITITAGADAKAMRVEAEIVKNGKTLSTYKADLSPNYAIAAATGPVKTSSSTPLLYIILGVIVAAGLLYLIIKAFRGSKSSQMLLVIVIIFGIVAYLIAYFITAQAFTTYSEINYGAQAGFSEASIATSTFKFIDANSLQNVTNFVFSPSQTFWMRGIVTESACSNAPELLIYKVTFSSDNIARYYAVDNGSANGSHFQNKNSNLPSGITNSSAFVAPSTPGSYTMSLSVFAISGTQSFNDNYPGNPNPHTLQAKSFSSYDTVVKNAGITEPISITQAQLDEMLNFSTSQGDYVNRIDATQNFTVANPAPTLTLSATPNPVDYNTASNLTWYSAHTTACTATGGWTGSKAVNGTQSTGNLTTAQTYTLQCVGAGGTTTQSVTVNVNPQVTVTGSLDAVPSSGIVPLNTTLTANVTGGTATGDVTYVFDFGDGSPTETYTTSNISQQVTHIYTTAGTWNPTVTITREGATATPSTTTTGSITTQIITTNPIPTATLNVTDNPINYGDSTDLVWSSTNATSCTGSNFSTSGATNNMSGVSTGSLTASQSYSITCTGPGGTSDPASVTVTVNRRASIQSCISDPPTSAGLGKQITWTAVVDQPGNHTYNWSGNTTCTSTSNTCTMTYTSPGIKHVSVSVDGGPVYACAPLTITFTEVEK